MVAQVMWDDVVPPSLQQRIADGLGVSVADARAWVIFFAGVHDIGKVSPPFQRKDESGAGRQRCVAAGLRWRAPEAQDRGHGRISAIVLADVLAERGAPWPVADRLSLAIGGHHGLYADRGDLDEQSGDPAHMGAAPWSAAREHLIQAVRDLTDLNTVGTPTICDLATATIIAGLVSVADWIGSDSSAFLVDQVGPTPVTLDLGGRAAQSQATARQILHDLGWLGWEATDEPPTFDALFPQLQGQARPLQQHIVTIPGLDRGPSMVIAELPMGEGKTEAAFLFSAYVAAVRGQRGAYIALPTMATSNQMFGRLRAFLEHACPTSRTALSLLHGQAALSPELEALLEDGRAFEPDGIDDTGAESRRQGDVIAAEWFTVRKRGLLAPFGVGTIDQGLLGALRVKHGFVRLFGLAGKTVVFDEVHAYDTYMTTLLERLLEWLGAMGTSVVLLSATLPRSRRDALLQAWARGAGQAIDTTALTAPYPRLSWATAAGAGDREVEVSALAQRRVALHMLPGHDDEATTFADLAMRLTAALEHGGCAAVICNTVRRAQAVYEALAQHFEGEIDLLHARFPFGERDAREKAALQRFGKPGGTVVMEDGRTLPIERPKRFVLVATQVVEQSLDLDFDLMVSDLAPIDLLLQRTGRLHRHQREATERLASTGTTPTLWVLGPNAVKGDIPTFDRGWAAVYDEEVLLRSWLLLRDRVSLAVPEDVEALVSAVYDSEVLAGFVGEPSSDLLEHVAQLREQRAKRRTEETTEARLRWTPAPSAAVPLSTMTEQAQREDDPGVHRAFQALTRLADPSVGVVLLHDTPAGLALTPDGPPVRLTGRPTIADARHLLRRAVTLSSRRVVYALLAQEPPKAWQQSALLSHHRLLVLDATGSCTVGTQVVRLDPKLGITITSASALQAAGE